MQNLNKQTGQPLKIFWFGDLVIPSGFGRIGNEVAKRLRLRGYDVQGAGIQYTGWPHDLPFWVWPLGNQDIWNGITAIVNQVKPDVLISCQDFPYHHTLWYGCKIDFSRLKWMWITPIDGTPVHPEWAMLGNFADGRMVISRFGVEALRQAGQAAALLHPGVSTQEFYPATAEEKQTLRAQAPKVKGRLDVAPDDFIVGVMCMNQGRKAISQMVAAFHEFARDKPNARLLLDMDKASPAGWDLPNLLKQMRWTEAEQARVRYREDMFKAETDPFAPLRNRYAILDAHMVISHREGFGLPLLESMACRVPTMALDWCSGTEIVGDGRGYLAKRLDYMEHGCWGGARDAFPDVADIVRGLNLFYAEPAATAAIAERGYQWAVQQTWDAATDQVEAVIQHALAQEPRANGRSTTDPHPQPAPGLSDIYGPAAGEGQTAARPIGDHSLAQRPGAPDSAAAVAGADGDRGRPAGEAGNPGAG